MKKSYLLVFAAAFLFAMASIISFIEGARARGVISLIGAICFVLSGIHYRRSGRKKNL